jgi:hypothetical protein
VRLHRRRQQVADGADRRAQRPLEPQRHSRLGARMYELAHVDDARRQQHGVGQPSERRLDR